MQARPPKPRLLSSYSVLVDPCEPSQSPVKGYHGTNHWIAASRLLDIAPSISGDFREQPITGSRARLRRSYVLLRRVTVAMFDQQPGTIHVVPITSRAHQHPRPSQFAAFERELQFPILESFADTLVFGRPRSVVRRPLTSRRRILLSESLLQNPHTRWGGLPPVGESFHRGIERRSLRDCPGQ
jgi:hypothetical protein